MFSRRSLHQLCWKVRTVLFSSFGSFELQEKFGSVLSFCICNTYIETSTFFGPLTYTTKVNIDIRFDSKGHHVNNSLGGTRRCVFKKCDSKKFDSKKMYLQEMRCWSLCSTIWAVSFELKTVWSIIVLCRSMWTTIPSFCKILFLRRGMKPYVLLFVPHETNMQNFR